MHNRKKKTKINVKNIMIFISSLGKNLMGRIFVNCRSTSNVWCNRTLLLYCFFFSYQIVINLYWIPWPSFSTAKHHVLIKVLCEFVVCARVCVLVFCCRSDRAWLVLSLSCFCFLSVCACIASMENRPSFKIVSK